MSRRTLGGGLDVGEYFRESNRDRERDETGPYNTALTGGMFGSAKSYRDDFSTDPRSSFDYFSGGNRMAGSIFEDEGSNQMMTGMIDQFQNEIDLGLSVLDEKGRNIANDRYKELMDKALRKAERKKSGGNFWSGLGQVASIGLGVASLLCDERLKTDIAPLQHSEVDDSLARMAFAVKSIRENS